MSNLYNTNEIDLDFGYSVTTLTTAREAYPGETADKQMFGKDFVSYDVSADNYYEEVRQGTLEGVILDAVNDPDFVGRVVARVAMESEDPALVLITASRVLRRNDESAADAVFASRPARKAIRDAANADFEQLTLLAAEFPAVVFDDRNADAEDRDGLVSGALRDEKELDNRVASVRNAEVLDLVANATLAPWMQKQFSKAGQKAILAALCSNKKANVRSIENNSATVRKAGFEVQIDLRSGVITSAKRHQS